MAAAQIITVSNGSSLNAEQVMAGIILQLPLVATWPDKKQNNAGSIEICATSPSGIGDAIRRMLATNNPTGTAVRFFDNVPENRLPFCHILLVNEASQRAAQYYINLVRGHSVLTVGTFEDFVRQGGVMGFLQANKQLGLFSEVNVRFDVNVTNARYERLVLDPLLLELAEEVVR
jgi:hypothetical protein